MPEVWGVHLVPNEKWRVFPEHFSWQKEITWDNPILGNPPPNSRTEASMYPKDPHNPPRYQAFQ